MKLFYSIVILFLGCLSFTECTNHIKREGDVRVIYPLRATRTVTDLSDYVAELELIPMSSDSLTLSGVIKMLITSDKYYFLSGGVVFSMDKSIEHRIKRIGEIGRGPGEYILVKDIAIYNGGAELWCLDVDNSILRYKTKDGSFVGDISIRSDIAHPKAIIPLTEDRFAIYVPNPLVKDMEQDDISFYCLRVFDIGGKERASGLLWKDYNIDAGFSSPVSYSNDSLSVLCSGSSHPCLVFNKGVETEHLFLDFEKKNVPFRYSFRAGSDPMLMLSDLFREDYYKLVSSVYFFGEDFYFCAYGEKSTLWNFILPKDGNSGIRWRSIGGLTPPISAIAIEDGSLFFAYEDYGEISQEEERDPLKKCVMNKFGVPSSNEPCIIKVKINV